VDNQGLGQQILDSHSGIERPERVLKDDLHVAAQVAEFLATSCKQVAAFEANRTRGGLDESENEPPQGAFARTGFAHQAKGFATPDLKRDFVYCANYMLRARPARETAARGENFRKVLDLNQRHDWIVPKLIGASRCSRRLLVNRPLHDLVLMEGSPPPGSLLPRGYNGTVPKSDPRNQSLPPRGRFSRSAAARPARQTKTFLFTVIVVLLVLAISLARCWHYIHGGAR
jgi:hypothetical protein